MSNMNSDSRPQSEAGQLFVVATPIGNLADITFRAVETLNNVDLIAAEDTRNSRKLLQHYNIHTPMIALHDHNERNMIAHIRALLEEGKSLALISDAGTPLISDPGYRLVQALKADGFDVIPVPGASSMTAALSACGLPACPLLFLGFLPRTGTARKAALLRMVQGEHTSMIFESPHRLLKTLQELAQLAGPQRRACVAREITKLHEDIRNGTLAELIDYYRQRNIKGECVILLAPDDSSTHTRAISDEEILACSRQPEFAALSPSARAREVAKRLGIDKARVYQLLVGHTHQQHP